MSFKNKINAPLAMTPELYQYVIENNGEHELLKKSREKTYELFPERAIMQTPPDESKFLGLLVKLMNVKTAVEVGVFTGYSSISIASSLPEDGKLYAFDISEEYTKVASDLWKEGGFDHKVDLRIGNAVELIDKLTEEIGEGSVDLAFVDADKVSYIKYFDALINLVRVGGVIVFDNTLFGGSVIDSNNNQPNPVAIRQVNEYIKNSDRVEHVLMGFADGVTLCLRTK